MQTNPAKEPRLTQIVTSLIEIDTSLHTPSSLVASTTTSRILMLPSGLSITCVQRDVSEWPDIMKHKTSNENNAVYATVKWIAAIVVAVLFTAFTLMLLRNFGGNLLVGIPVSLLPAGAAIVSWRFAIRGFIAESRRRASPPIIAPTECPDAMEPASSSEMNEAYVLALRIAAIVAGVPSTAITLLLLWPLLKNFRAGGDVLTFIFLAVSATVAIISWLVASRAHIAESRRRITSALVGGIMLGGICFAAGFFGPLILTPQSNQGPLLGIFITGPLGFVLGAIIGWLTAWIRGSKQGPS
jgi:hypothetical protein